MIEAKDLPEGDKVYLEKRFGRWQVVAPVKNPDGTWNWFNLFTGGSWINVAAVAIITFVMCGLFWEYSHNLHTCVEVIKRCQPILIP